jgi:hypothetical protein
MASGTFTGVPHQQATRDGLVNMGGGGAVKLLAQVGKKVFKKALKSGAKSGATAVGKSATSAGKKVGAVGASKITKEMVKKGVKKAAKKAAKEAAKGALKGGVEAAAHYYMMQNSPQGRYAGDRAATRAGLQMTSQRVRGTSSSTRTAAATGRKKRASLGTRMQRLMRYMEQSRAARQRLLTQGRNYRYVRQHPFGMGAGKKKKTKKKKKKKKKGKTTKAGKKGKRKPAKRKKKTTGKKRATGKRKSGKKGVRSMNVAASQRRWQQLRDVFRPA